MTMQHVTGLQATGRLLTGAPAYVARTPWSWWSAIGMGFVVLIAATTLSIPIAIGAMTIGTPDLGKVFGDPKAVRVAFEAPVVMAATMLGWQVAIVLFTLLIARWYGGLRREVLALETFPHWQTIVLAIIGGMLLTLPFDILGLTYFKDTVKADTSSFIPMVKSQWWPFFALTITIGAPLSEEILFRGFLQSALAKTGIGFIGATLLTAVGWTALHVQYSWFGLAQVFVIGLYFSWLLWRSGTLWLPIIVHAVYNTLSFTLLKTGVIGG